jgi:hypothetical protein
MRRGSEGKMCTDWYRSPKQSRTPGQKTLASTLSFGERYVWTRTKPVTTPPSTPIVPSSLTWLPVARLLMLPIWDN